MAVGSRRGCAVKTAEKPDRLLGTRTGRPRRGKKKEGKAPTRRGKRRQDEDKTATIHHNTGGAGGETIGGSGTSHEEPREDLWLGEGGKEGYDKKGVRRIRDAFPQRDSSS